MHLPTARSKPSFRRFTVAAIIALTLGAGPLIADELQLADGAPDRYVVVKGDTLWGIAGKFLKDPWKWPQIWKMNQDDIKNPHWIFPGDVIVMDMVNGEPRLRLLGNSKNDAMRRDVKMQPRVRVVALENAAAPTIDAALIDPLLSRPMVVDEKEFNAAPRVALAPDSRVVISMGDRFQAVGLGGQPGDDWQIFRAGKELKDPDTKEVLGYEVTFVGEASARDIGPVSTLQVHLVAQEIAIGDRLLPKSKRVVMNYVPRFPEGKLEAKVLGTYGGLDAAGPYATVVLNRGERDGLAPGHVLFSFKAPRPVMDERGKPDKLLIAPAEKSGNVFIYRVFPKLSYGLVLDSTRPIELFDVVRKP
ncbi:LysM peptidoglycan-binding domain-containing protein [Chitinimonas sp.]|uniref:LysM peptidoglycan-binding domain-containing protein n=1 Tax=Chitinimonas sp. TaxID=1934313 RepID=UPI0035B12768